MNRDQDLSSVKLDLVCLKYLVSFHSFLCEFIVFEMEMTTGNNKSGFIGTYLS